MSPSSSVRPWQGMLLGVASWVAFGLLVFMAAQAIVGFNVLSSISSSFVASGGEEGAAAAGIVSGALQGVGYFFGVIFVAIALLFYFIARGLMNGKRWTLFFVSIVGVLYALSSGYEVILAWAIADILSFVIAAGSAALALSVINNPFYNPQG